MSQLRKDPVTGRWVIVNVDDPKQADFFKTGSHKKSSKTCPFCPGNESMTPSEIMILRKKLKPKELLGWSVRVIPNKFPALRIEENPAKAGIGVYDKTGGFGAHEVIIETPDHHQELWDSPLEQVELALRAFRDRCLDLRRDSRFQYILIFKNYGAQAGASLEHPHSQLIGLPIVPSRVAGEVKGAARHFESTGRCIYCDMLAQERHEKKFTVHEENGFLTLCPFASRFPFETWILPVYHEASFDAITDHNLAALAGVLKETLLKIKKALNDPSFNLMIHTIPIYGKEFESYHWHIEIIPHLTRVAGFELGTGFYVNATSPELAAKTLKASRDFYS